jgi:hypothetical protein
MLAQIKNMKEVLNYIVDKHFALFTYPDTVGEVPQDEANEILRVIEDATSFVSKEDANFAIKVSENADKVRDAIDEHIVTSKKFIEHIDEDLTTQFKTAFENDQFQTEKIQAIKTGCETVKGFTSPRSLDTIFNDVRRELRFSQSTVKEFKAFNSLLKLVKLIQKLQMISLM